jgi:hypothetical protein
MWEVLAVQEDVNETYAGGVVKKIAAERRHDDYSSGQHAVV